MKLKLRLNKNKMYFIPPKRLTTQNWKTNPADMIECRNENHLCDTTDIK